MELFIFNPHAEKEMSPRVFWALFYWSLRWAYSVFEELCLHNAGLMRDSPVGLVFRNLEKTFKWSVEDFKSTLAKEVRVMSWFTHIGVGVLRLSFGQRGVTVRAVVLTEVIGSLRVGGDQQLLDVSLSAAKKYLFMMEFHGTSWSAMAGDPQPNWINGCSESIEPAIQNQWMSPGKITKVEVNEDLLLTS